MTHDHLEYKVDKNVIDQKLDDRLTRYIIILFKELKEGVFSNNKYIPYTFLEKLLSMSKQEQISSEELLVINNSYGTEKTLIYLNNYSIITKLPFKEPLTEEELNDLSTTNIDLFIPNGIYLIKENNSFENNGSNFKYGDNYDFALTVRAIKTFLWLRYKIDVTIVTLHKTLRQMKSISCPANDQLVHSIITSYKSQFPSSYNKLVADTYYWMPPDVYVLLNDYPSLDRAFDFVHEREMIFKRADKVHGRIKELCNKIIGKGVIRKTVLTRVIKIIDIKRRYQKIDFSDDSSNDSFFKDIKENFGNDLISRNENQLQPFLPKEFNNALIFPDSSATDSWLSVVSGFYLVEYLLTIIKDQLSLEGLIDGYIGSELPFHQIMKLFDEKRALQKLYDNLAVAKKLIIYCEGFMTFYSDKKLEQIRYDYRSQKK